MITFVIEWKAPADRDRFQQLWRVRNAFLRYEPGCAGLELTHVGDRLRSYERWDSHDPSSRGHRERELAASAYSKLSAVSKALENPDDRFDARSLGLVLGTHWEEVVERSPEIAHVQERFLEFDSGMADLYRRLEPFEEPAIPQRERDAVDKLELARDVRALIPMALEVGQPERMQQFLDRARDAGLRFLGAQQALDQNVERGHGQSSGMGAEL
jgi:hypothetical protein